MLRKTLTMAVAAFAAIAGTLIVASPAQAAYYCPEIYHNAETDENWDGAPGGKLCFEEYGDEVQLLDNDSDGYRVELTVRVGGNTRYTLTASGFGVIAEAQAGDGYASHNLPEDTYITFEMYLYSANTQQYAGSVSKTWFNDQEY